MALYLHRLGALAARRAWTVILTWTLLLALTIGSAATLARPFTSKLTIPGTEFQNVLDDLEREYPKAAGGISTVVFSTKNGTPFDERQRQLIGEVTQEWSAINGIDDVLNPFTAQKQLDDAATQLTQGRQALEDGRTKITENEQKLNQAKLQLEQISAHGGPAVEQARNQIADGEKQLDTAKKTLAGQENQINRGERRLALMKGLRAVTPDGHVALAQITFAKPVYEVSADVKDDIPAKATRLADAGIQTDYAKEIAEKIQLAGPGEAVGLLVAGLVLVVMLGSLLAAGLPLLAALIGVGIGLLATATLTHWVEMTDVTPALALMLGLAVGIDYSLFLVSRHREQLARGMELRASIAHATGTAGSAVVFAGLTVVVALSALALTGIPFLGTMGFVAAATVAVAVLVAITLSPALLALIGPRILSPRARRTLLAKLDAEETEADAEDAEERRTLPAGEHHEHLGHGWGGFVTRHPIRILIAATILLSVLAVPAAGLRLGLPDGSHEPKDSTGHRSYAAIAQHFGPGRNGPILAVAKVDEKARAQLDDTQRDELQLTIGEKLRKTPGVADVIPAFAIKDGRAYVYQVIPTTGPSDEATSTLVSDLRTARDQIITTHQLTSLGFAGQTVANIDISHSLADALPIYLTVVVGISLILLLLVFRSVVVPVLATAGFLLSVAAAFGALVAVYQWGWLGTLFGVENPGPVLSFLPTLVIGILFGLAMDYQMFLVSGMREAWAHGHTARTAVRTGFSHGARVVTAAALIMTAVFASFVYAHLTMIRPIGFALAVGVLIDAFVVRMTAMPAVMHLLGERAWYLPRALGRILPDLDVEGTALVRAADPAATPHRQGEDRGVPL